ncbi:MAG: D-alanyl-D-alanine carboxypeptidase [Thermomicrobiales bacterium]|nr:D-alanyl-D-alanine carboxypeptidase [Thermomicrobiales bacterium]
MRFRLRHAPALSRVALAALLATLLLLQGVAHATVAAPLPHVEPLPPPPVSAKSVLVTDISTGTELFARDPDQPLPPASLTKIVSALVILDHVNLDDAIEIIDADLVDPEQSQVGLVAGDTLSARDLLFGVLIPSGNDATLALARHVGAAALGGSPTPEEAVAAFVTMMNEKAAALGATHSHFANPTGIDADGHVMSARDIAIVTAAALQNPLFAEIVSTPRATLHSEKLADGYAITTTNELLLAGLVNGVKTGSTPKAGGCLVTAFDIGPNRVLAVMLGSEVTETAEGAQDYSTRFLDARTLMDAANADYVWLDPAAPGVVAGLLEELSVWNVDLGDDDLLPVPADTISEMRYRLVLSPPAAPDSPAGEVQFFVGDRLLSQRAALQTG